MKRNKKVRKHVRKEKKGGKKIRKRRERNR
jgi:hypothetical protein